MADPREGPGRRGPPIIFRPNRNPKGRKKFFWRTAPPLSKGLDALTPPPPPYLKVWIWHCYLPPKLLQYVAYAATLCSHGRAEAGEHKLEHILLSKYINSPDSFYWQMLLEPLTLDI